MLLAVGQVVSNPLDVEANVGRHVEAVRDAAERGARLVVLPELSLTGYELGGISTVALSPGDVRLEPLREVSRSTGATAVVGAPTRRDGRTYLSAVADQPDGEAITAGEPSKPSPPRHGHTAGTVAEQEVQPCASSPCQ